MKEFEKAKIKLEDLKTYCIYKHTNKENNESYVGMTKFGDKPEKRWGKNGEGYLTKSKDGEYMQKKFANAINKYSWNKFNHEILKNNLTLAEAISEEKLNINKYNCIDNGYNVLEGGCKVFYKYLPACGIVNISDTYYLNGKHKECELLRIFYLTSEIGHPNMLLNYSLKNPLIKMILSNNCERQIFFYIDFKQPMFKIVDYQDDTIISEHYIPFSHMYNDNYKIFAYGEEGLFDLTNRIDYFIKERIYFGNMSGAAEVLYDYKGNLYREYFWDVNIYGTGYKEPKWRGKYPASIEYETNQDINYWREEWKYRIKNKYIIESDCAEYLYSYCIEDYYDKNNLLKRAIKDFGNNDEECLESYHLEYITKQKEKEIREEYYDFVKNEYNINGYNLIIYAKINENDLLDLNIDM